MKNEFLQDVIADAEVIKKMAIENAKASLNETFDSKLKSMLSAKLQEEADEMIDEEEETNEDFEFEGRKKADDSEEDESEEESDEEEAEEETDESLDIDAILAEMESEEEDEEGEGKADEAYGKGKVKGSEKDYSDAEPAGKGKKDGEESDMAIGSGDAEADEEEITVDYSDASDKGSKKGKHGLDEKSEEGDEEGDEEEMEEEYDLEALLAEMEELEEKKGEEEDEDESEEEKADEAYEGEDYENEGEIDENAKEFISKLKTLGKDQMKKLKKFYDNELSPKSVQPGGKYAEKGYAAIPSHKSAMEELNEAKKEMAALVKKINTTNLINAKLLYFNKIMKDVDLNESQKIKVMQAFDKVRTTGEAKLVYEALNQTFTSKKSTKTTSLKESYGFKGGASKSAGVSTAKQTIISESESDANVKRWQKLAGLIK